VRNTIKSNTDISAVFTRGKRYNSSGMTFIVLEAPQHDPSGRVAFIAGKKNGNAVWRNAAKRRMRALCNELKGPWPGIYVIFLAKRNILEVSYRKALNEGKKQVHAFQNRGAISSSLCR
jgi:ribonuclease P protein component